MIPLLLWRCPLCATNDALVHIERRLRADLVHCLACQAEWRVRRVPGDNFYLKLTRGQASSHSYPQDERSITAWYDAMKATLSLEPIHDPVVALRKDENLYLASGQMELYAEDTDPLFFPVSSPTQSNPLDKGEIQNKMVGRGRLFLTDQRLIFWGQSESEPRTFHLHRLNSAFAFLDYGLTLMYEMRLYTIHYLEESLLKWVTYIALIAPRVKAETGHQIATSHF